MAGPKKKTSIASFTIGKVTLVAIVDGDGVTDTDIRHAKLGLSEFQEVLEGATPTPTAEQAAE